MNESHAEIPDGLTTAGGNRFVDSFAIFIDDCTALRRMSARDLDVLNASLAFVFYRRGQHHDILES